MNKTVRRLLTIMIGVSLMMGCDNSKQDSYILYDFESDSTLDQFHWQCHTLFSLSDNYATQGKKSLKIEFYPSAYPGLAPKLNFNDWRGYQFFKFDIYNPSSNKLKIVLRIDDKKDALEYNERYNQSFEVIPGPNSFEIPLESLKTSEIGRPLNLKSIYSFLIFMVNPKQKHILYFDNFQLSSIY